jgi:hypothetical protein
MKKKKGLLFKLKRVLQKQATKTQQNLTFILVGFALSLLGIALVMGGEYMVSDPLHREVVALIGIIIITISCILALIGYISLSILRIFYVITSDTPDDDEKK